MDYIVRATAADGQIRAFAATTRDLVAVSYTHLFLFLPEDGPASVGNAVRQGSCVGKPCTASGAYGSGREFAFVSAQPVRDVYKRQ